MRIKVCLLLGIMCVLTACAKEQQVPEYSAESKNTEYENAEYENKEYLDTEFAEIENDNRDIEETVSHNEPDIDIGIPIYLPENTTWITDREYKKLDENSIEIKYYDTISEADCTVLVVKDGTLNLPDKEYDETRDETWDAWTSSNQRLSVKVQHTTDSKAVLAAWTYDNYNFAIWGVMSSEQMDSSPIPKTALYIIQNLD